jgi:TPR repeat protein
MELSPDLPPQYEERLLAAKLDCDNDKGAADACHAVGEFLSVVKNDHAGARKAFEKNCASGHGASCFALGRLLLGGKGGPLDERKGEATLKKGCALEHAPSCHHLGLMAFGRSDERAGEAHMATACAMGLSQACHVLGGALLRPGKGRDAVKANGYLETACADGHAPACHNLAVMFRKGDAGVPADAALFDRYAQRTRALVEAAGAARGVRVA